MRFPYTERRPATVTLTFHSPLLSLKGRFLIHSSQMLQNQNMMQDREMQRDMDRLREHMNQMPDWLASFGWRIAL